jgi:hypothetical protein
MTCVRIRQGKIVEAWNNFDFTARLAPSNDAGIIFPDIIRAIRVIRVKNS